MDTNTSDRFLPVVQSVWRRTVGRSEKDPLAQYIIHSVAEEVATNGIPDSTESSRDRFEDILASSEAVDADDSIEFCETLVTALELEQEQEIDESCLQPEECEICERLMPLTKHHLIPRMLHTRLLKKGYARALLNKTADICRLCHTAVHHFFTEKELAMEYNTIDKLMQTEQILSHAKWANKQPVRSRRRHWERV